MAEYIEREAVLRRMQKIATEAWKMRIKANVETVWNEAQDVLRFFPAADVRPVVQREAVMQALNKYFSIGDSYTYELNRVKEAFYVGTMTLDDFEEWDEDNVSDLCDYLMKEIFGPNCGADMRGES